MVSSREVRFVAESPRSESLGIRGDIQLRQLLCESYCGESSQTVGRVCWSAGSAYVFQLNRCLQIVDVGCLRRLSRIAPQRLVPSAQGAGVDPLDSTLCFDLD